MSLLDDAPSTAAPIYYRLEVYDRVVFVFPLRSVFGISDCGLLLSSPQRGGALGTDINVCCQPATTIPNNRLVVHKWSVVWCH